MSKRINFTVEKSEKEMLDQIFDHGELSETFRDVVDRIIETEGYTRQTVYDARIEEKKSKLETKRQKRDRLDREIDELTDEIGDLREQRSNLLSKEDEYHGALKTIEHGLRKPREGREDTAFIGAVWPTHPRIQALAEQYDKTPQTVMDDLRERNPDVPERAFTEKNGAFAGFEDGRDTLPLSERESP